MSLFKSWRTSGAGSLSVLAMIVSIFVDDPKWQMKLQQVGTLIAGGGLLAARDNKVSSKDLGLPEQK